MVDVLDPTTGAAYAVAKAPSAALGQIEYRPGGRCVGTQVTPGKTGSRYLALVTKLETSETPACVDVSTPLN